MGISCSYYMEPVDTTDLPRRFLEAFAAILAHSNYTPVLEMASRLATRCARCTVTCPVYQATGEPRDIPCRRSELLLKVYRRYDVLEYAESQRLMVGTWDTVRKTVDSASLIPPGELASLFPS